MKKKKTLVIIVIALLAIVGVVFAVTLGNGNGEYSFTAKIVEVKDNYLFVEVTDSGNSSLSVGTKVDVSTSVTSADGCPVVVAEEYVRVVFNGEVMEKNPPAIGMVFKIYKTDETGKSIGD